MAPMVGREKASRRPVPISATAARVRPVLGAGVQGIALPPVQMLLRIPDPAAAVRGLRPAVRLAAAAAQGNTSRSSSMTHPRPTPTPSAPAARLAVAGQALAALAR